ncbi:MAG TPA: glycosyltransferase family 2 protein [Polyangiaceae bacterium]|nr:glycosyltransferase family 2 protein [Polyangiaceae bacterium]
MIEGVNVVVVVPAHRERLRLPRVLETMPAEVDSIVVVDDASDDGTFEVAKRSADPRVVVLRHDANRGVGAAIATGYARALASPGHACDAFVVMAGDGQMDGRDLPALVRPIARGEAGYAKGNRFAWPGARSIFPRARWVGGHVFSRLTSAALSMPVHDSQCGFTAISREACSRIDLGSLWPRFGYPNDLLSLLRAANVRVIEVPVRPVYAGEKSQLHLWHLPVIAGVVARAWLRRRQGVASPSSTYYLGRRFEASARKKE